MISRAEFLKQVTEGRMLPSYLFLGEERLFHRELLQAALAKLLDPADLEFNFIRLNAKDTNRESLLSQMGSPSFFGGTRVIHLDGLEENSSGLEEDLLKGIVEMADGVHLFVSAFKLDGRRKLHQELQKRLIVVDCATIQPNDLSLWIKQRSEKLGLQLTPAQQRTVGERLGPDLLRTRTELEKLKTFLGTRPQLNDSELDDLIPGEPEPDIFGLIDAVARRDPRLGLPRLKDLLDSGENETKILATLARQFRNITAAYLSKEQGLNPKQLAGLLGINPYVAEKSYGQTRGFSLQELSRIMDRLTMADFRMKTGQRESRLELELAVTEICSITSPQ